VVLSLIVAVSKNGVIGRGGQLPWKLPADMARFKSLTMGHPIIMGRNTYESIGRPLPGRRNIVLSSQPNVSLAGVEVVPTWEAALDLVREDGEVFVIGGAALYRKAFPDADRLYLTLVEADVAGDVFFDMPNASHWRLVSEEFRPPDVDHAYPLSFKIYERG
jgi:dihydrofolate reductase